MLDNILNGLSVKTVNFYLEKISSLYSATAHKLEGGKLPFFKDIKKKFKDVKLEPGFHKDVKRVVDSLRLKYQLYLTDNKKPSSLVENLLHFRKGTESRKSLKLIWAALALNSGVRPDIIKTVCGAGLPQMPFLDLIDEAIVDEKEINKVIKTVNENLIGEDFHWFAMRLRPGAKFEDIVTRFSSLDKEMRLPELFYPVKEIAKQIGRKVVWKDKPVINGVIFFRYRRSDIYPLFTQLYDLAWCYRNPGNRPGNYASIPSKAMDEFRDAIGFLTPDFELAPQGEMELKPGDEVVIVDGNYLNERARILKKPTFDSDGNKIFRVTLLNSNGRWDIGIDARLLKK